VGGGCCSLAKPVSFLTLRQASHCAFVARRLSTSRISATRPSPERTPGRGVADRHFGDGANWSPGRCPDPPPLLSDVPAGLRC
jgi:hypothetical protein